MVGLLKWAMIEGSGAMRPARDFPYYTVWKLPRKNTEETTQP